VIAVKIEKSCYTPARRAAVASGFALAVVLRKVGRFEDVKVHGWRDAPNITSSGERIDVELSVNTADSVAKEFAHKRWRRITVALAGTLGSIKLGVEIDVYANECIPVWARITKEGVDVLAKPRGYVGDRVVESFYELFDLEHEKMKKVIEEFFTEMNHKLWRAVSGVYALRSYSFAPEDAVPLWRRLEQVARDLYRLAPPGLRELVGLRGMEKTIKNVMPELLKYLERYYEAKQYKDIVQLIPLSTKRHRESMAELRSVLAEVMRETSSREVQRIISEVGYLDWVEYVKAFEEELRQKLKTLS